MDYDILIIGDSREGVERAVAEAQSGRRVALVMSGKIPVGIDVMQQAAQTVAASTDVSMGAWKAEVARLDRVQSKTVSDQLVALGVDQFVGAARFVTSAMIEVASDAGRRQIESFEFVLACGTRSRRPNFLFTNEHGTVTVESLLSLRDLPRSAVVVGAGDTGLSTALTLATLGTEVVVVDQHATLLELCGLFDATFDAIQTLDIAFRLEDEVIGVTPRPDYQTAVTLASGRQLVAENVVACVGREGLTEGLNLEAVGVGIDERGRVWCNRQGRTWVKQISAIGDVVGFPRNFEAAGFERLPAIAQVGRSSPATSGRVLASTHNF